MFWNKYYIDLSMSVFLPLKISLNGVFLSGGSEERKDGALNVVGLAIFS